MPRSLRTLTIAVALATFAACASEPLSFAPGERCVTPAFSVVDGFTGARRGRCTVLADDHVRLDIRPEDEGRINDSPWYAFRIVPAVPGIMATENARPGISGYPFRNSRSNPTNGAIANYYIHARYGIPSVTCEVGDETDRDAVRDAAQK